tara:strand:- start:2755 stop:3279 length:525 start_codon:yes stop_codon:yes gene_type:complete
MVIWITGISGTGKTTLGKYFYKCFKKENPSTIYFDGDKFRSIFKNDIKYSLEDRNTNAQRLTALVKHLSDQKINIIISANITTFSFRKWCRKNIKNYIEVYIQSTKKILAQRDYKNLYKMILQKKIKNVVGIDLPFKKPNGCHVYLKNNKSKDALLKNYNMILNLIKKKKKKIY